MITGILVARLLGPAGRGEFTVAILWPSIIASLGSLGVKEALTFQQAKGSQPASRLAGAAFLLAAVQATLLCALGLVLIPLLTQAQEPGITQISSVYLLVIPANLAAQYSLGLLQGNLEIHRYNLNRLLVSALFALAVLLLWASNHVSVNSLVLSLLMANSIAALVAVLTVLIRFGVRWTLDLHLMRTILDYGLRNHLGSISYQLNQRADQMILAIFVAPQELGWYTVSASVAGIATLASGAFAVVVFPKVAMLEESERFEVTSRYSRYNVTLTLLFAGALLIATPFLIPILYGSDFAPSVLPAEILILSTVFVGIGQAWAGVMRGLGRPLVPAKAELLSLVATVIGLALLLPLYGIIGAAVTSFGAYLIAAVFLYLQLHRSLGVGPGDVLKPISPRLLIQSLLR